MLLILRIKPKVPLNLSKAALNYGVTDLSEASTTAANTASYVIYRRTIFYVYFKFRGFSTWTAYNATILSVHTGFI